MPPQTATTPLNTQTTYSNYTIHNHFPSLIATIIRLRELPWHTGWLLGCIAELSRYFISAFLYTQHLDNSNLEHELNIARRFTSQYLRDISPPDSDMSWWLDTLISAEELIDYVRTLVLNNEIERLIRPAIHHDPLRILRRGAIDANMDINIEDVETKIEEVEAKYIKQVWGAVVTHLFNGDREHEDIVFVENGWESGESSQGCLRSYRLSGSFDISRFYGEFLDDLLVPLPSPLMQYEPDDTPVEYEVTGAPLPEYAYSSRYIGLLPPAQDCAICLEGFDSGWGRDWEMRAVVARCSAMHVFHSKCLSRWVNGSAMERANTCPVDRQRICGARERRHIRENS